MPSFAERLFIGYLLAAAAGALMPYSANAQSGAAERYTAIKALEVRVTQSPAAGLVDFRTTVERYWQLVRRYPTSGYSDNALWQGGFLSFEAYRRFGDDRDRRRAVELFERLRDHYPHSSLRAEALVQLNSIGATGLLRDEGIVATPIAETDAQPSAAPAVPDVESAAVRVSAAGTASIRAVNREVLPEVVRVTIELDREVAFQQERLENPPRVFFDLHGARAVPALVDAELRYDTDLVRQIRLGRHPNARTRVVLDLEGVTSYSVFTLYNPYRIVIDADRGHGARRAATDAETAGTRSVSVAARALPPPTRRPVVSIPSSKMPVTAPAPDTPPAQKPELQAAAPPLTATSPAPSEPPAGDAQGKPLAPSANLTGKFSVARQLGLGVSRVVIDAGHGGHDPGATAFGVSEAELVLDVAQRLEKLLLQQPGMEVVLTRRTDEFVPLEERTEIANRESADLFLSIHANASASAAARGVETYFLNFALNRQAEAVAARENAASGKTMNSLPGIIQAITMNNKLNESRDFAASVQRALVRTLRTSNRSLRDLGVKQAPFMVLVGASMPSVLAEIAFVTNRQEARLLKTPAYRQKIAEALLAGIVRYQQSLKKVETAASLR